MTLISCLDTPATNREGLVFVLVHDAGDNTPMEIAINENKKRNLILFIFNAMLTSISAKSIPAFRVSLYDSFRRYDRTLLKSTYL